jgi:hypothetical protein
MNPGSQRMLEIGVHGLQKNLLSGLPSARDGITGESTRVFNRSTPSRAA